MAVTIEQSPSTDFVLSGNPIIWVFSSNQTGQDNFSYYVEVYVDGVLNSSHQVFPESGIYGKFDASQIAESVSGIPSTPTTLIGEESTDWVFTYIKVYERYGTTPSLQASATSSTELIIKGKLFKNTWINSDLNNYFIDSSSEKLLLTDNNEFTLHENELLNIYFCVDAGSFDDYYIFLKYYNESGTLLNTSSQILTKYRKNCLSVSWNILDGLYSLNDVGYVVMYLEDDSNVKSTIDYTINIDKCFRPDTTRLHFLNQLGGVDAFTFDAVSKQSMSTQTNSFLTTQGGFDGAAYTYSTTNSQTGNYQVTSNTKLMLESNWINEDIMQWLNDNLFTSPYILMETANGLQRVANTSASVKYKKNRNDTAFNVVIELDLQMHSSMII